MLTYDDMKAKNEILNLIFDHGPGRQTRHKFMSREGGET